MSIVYHIDKERGITYVRWDGVVTADEFLAHVRRLTSDPDWPPHARLHLADLRHTTPDVSMDQAALQRAADIFGAHPKELVNMRAAAVAGDAFNMAVDFERVASRYGATVIVFNLLDTACTWLGLDEGEAQRALQELHGRIASVASYTI